MPLDARFDGGLDATEQLAPNADRAKLRKVDSAIATDGEAQSAIRIAVKLDFEFIACTHDIVGRHWDIGHGRERGCGPAEQVVPERLETLDAGLLQGEPGQADLDGMERRLGLQTQACLILRKTQQGNARESRQRQDTVA